jgi:hypothetical protein
VAACNEFVNVYGSVGQPLSTVEVAIDTDDPSPARLVKFSHEAKVS